MEETRSARCWAFAKSCALLTLVLVNNVMFVPSFLAVMLFLWPLRLIKPHVYWGIESFILRHLAMCVSLWMLLAKVEVFQEGEDINNYVDEPCLVLVNHQSSADVPLLVHVVNALSGYSYKIMWVLDRMFKWSPFGLICQIHGDLFIQEGKQGEERYGLNDLSKQLKRKFWPRRRRWIVVFPEGGFLYKRLESSQRYGRKTGLPIFQHVVLPRTGAVQMVLEICSSATLGKDGKTDQQQLRHLLDVTIGYENGDAFSLWNICTGTVASKTVIIRYRCYDVAELPGHSKEEIMNHLCTIWADKEEWLKRTIYQPEEKSEVEKRVKLLIPMECALFSQGVMMLISLASYIAIRLLSFRFLLAAGCTFWVLRKMHNYMVINW